jgi:hypothetical protein
MAYPLRAERAVGQLATVSQVIERTYDPKAAEKIGICVPSLGTISMQWHARMELLARPMNTASISVYVIGKKVDQARNESVAMCLNENCRWVFFVDDDVFVPSDALLRLYAYQRDIVSGLYFAKMDPPTPLVLRAPGQGLYLDWEQGDLVECEGHGMGCTLIRADVFRTIEPHVPKRDGIPQWFVTRDFPEEVGADGSKMVMTEDVDFLAKCAHFGFRPAVATEVFCWHWSAVERRVYPLHEWEPRGGASASGPARVDP